MPSLHCHQCYRTYNVPPTASGGENSGEQLVCPGCNSEFVELLQADHPPASNGEQMNGPAFMGTVPAAAQLFQFLARGQEPHTVFFTEILQPFVGQTVMGQQQEAGAVHFNMNGNEG